MSERPLRQIWFCFGCVREVLLPQHCGRVVRMYSIDLRPGGRDVTRHARPPAPEEFIADPENEDEEEEIA